MAELTCAERIDEYWTRTIDQLKEILDARDPVEKLNEIALSWDPDQTDEYDSLCLSWGGPADYIRYYKDGRISYCFQDWFDGAENFLDGADFNLAKEVYERVLV